MRYVHRTHDVPGAPGPVGGEGTTVTMSWLDLLLADASSGRIAGHRDELIGEGMEPALAERETGLALRLAALLDQRRRQAAELAALNDIVAQLTTLRRPDAVLREITTQARRLLGVDLTYLALVRGEHAVVEAVTGAMTPQLHGQRLSLTTGMFGLVFTRREPFWTEDYLADGSFPHASYDAVAGAERMRALLGVPLMLRGRALGALFVCKRQERHFTENEITLLSALAAHAALAIDNAETMERYEESAAQLAAANGQLERALEWDRRLTDVVLSGGGVAGLLGEMAGVVCREVRFIDDGADIEHDLAERVPALPGSLTVLLKATGDEPQWDELTAEDSEPVRLRAVRTDRGVAGALVLIGAYEPSGRLLLERALPTFALAVVGERAVAEATRLTRDAMLVDLLNRPATDPDELRQRMRVAGLEPSRVHCVLVALPCGERQSARRDLTALPLPLGTVTAVDGPRLVAVVPTGDPGSLAEAWQRHGADTATVGVAGPTSSPMELAGCYYEALQTVNALLTLEQPGTATTARRLGVYRVLLDRAGRDELSAQFEALLGAVDREQERRRIPLLATVRTYLDQGRRAAPAARLLGIHVNTLYQRLEILDTVLGQSWREPPRALDLQILLRVAPPDRKRL